MPAMQAVIEKVLLAKPERVRENLSRMRDADVAPRVPNPWQICQGVVRMWHRVVFRPETIGMSTAFQPRSTLRARVLENRPLRFPFLLRERAIAPLDFSGLASTPQRIISHLLGAHHDGHQFVYDLQLLAVHEGALDEVERRALAVVSGEDPRAAYLRDLVVYENYHENLLEAVRAFKRGELELAPEDDADPDISFTAYLGWCAAQPETPSETLRVWLGAPRSRATLGEGAITRDQLLAFDRAQLREVMNRGHAIEPSALEGMAYQGVSLGMPRLFEELSWKKFQKTFHRDPRSGALRGWNVRLEQNGLDEPCVPKTKDGAPFTFGHFEVVPAHETPAGLREGFDGLMIDYGRGENGADVTSVLRDPLVAVNEGDASLLLGYSIVALGPAKIPTPTYFLLERPEPLAHVAHPPARTAA
jgi:hypothetical protein